MNRIVLAIRLTAVAVVTLVGAGACTFGPQEHRAGGPAPVNAASGTTGASGSPGPIQPGGTAPAGSRRPSSQGPDRAGSPSPAGSAGPTGSTGSAGSAGSTTPSRLPAGCTQGEQQREVETYLARLGGFGPVEVDGRQSAADCAAIKRFQRRYGISPAAGRAGPTTADVAGRLARTNLASCRAGKGTTFCVDLTHQTVWVVRDGHVLLGPTVTRTGKPGYATVSGSYTIDYRNPREWSTPYEVWMPLWQHFYGGMGFHETTTYLHDMSIGSHGCVNLLPEDARRMWELGSVGTHVRLFGRRPGT
ncbi:L,D-transpeptidase family protein [Plantactinospora siamensis]|uniref:L,D-transpeptidase family protein n=1 Tax=Plantactinospora siamensis TaxID=555372 RepID=A0ABV6NVJ2_9ACTN